MHDILSVYKGTYDAWGNIVSKSGSMADINPFRYRGYYYDNETGFYYLQTRYYDPSIRQFINADNYELLPILSQTIGQLNLFAYANNNPIMLTDETGETFLTSLLVGVIIGAVIGGTIGGVSASMQGENLVGGILSGALVGGVLGATTILGSATALTIGGKSVAGFIAASTFAGKGALLATTVGATISSSFVAGVGSYAIETHFNNRQFSWNEAIRSGGSTALKGLTNYGIGMVMGVAGAYNYLLNGVPNRTFGRMLVDGIRNGIISNCLRLFQFSWYYVV